MKKIFMLAALMLGTQSMLNGSVGSDPLTQKITAILKEEQDTIAERAAAAKFEAERLAEEAEDAEKKNQEKNALIISQMENLRRDKFDAEGREDEIRALYKQLATAVQTERLDRLKDLVSQEEFLVYQMQYCSAQIHSIREERSKIEYLMNPEQKRQNSADFLQKVFSSITRPFNPPMPPMELQPVRRSSRDTETDGDLVLKAQPI
jgi:multidrug efflux pump subunit AcrA (membrane-fusion protein)